MKIYCFSLLTSIVLVFSGCDDEAKDSFKGQLCGFARNGTYFRLFCTINANQQLK